MSGQLCLRWNNHATAFNKLLNNIHLEDAYSDGTIMCHGKFYPVHRFVLSTCSEYFELMFRQCDRLKNKHPFIIVKDIHPEQMEALLSYMYKGEVNVPQEMLPELIKAAEAFKIRGLAVPDDENAAPKTRKRSSISSPPTMSKKSRRYEGNSSCSNQSEIDGKFSENINNCENSSSTSVDNSDRVTDQTNANNTSCTNVKEEPVDDDQLSIINDGDSTIKEEEEVSYKPLLLEEEDETVKSFDFDASVDNYDEGLDSNASWDNSQAYEAEEGGEDDPTQRFAVNHDSVAASASGSLLYCSDSTLEKTCPYRPCTFKTKHAHHLQYHIRTHTGEKPFQCPQCSYKCVQKCDLKLHQTTVHACGKHLSCPRCEFKTAHKKSLKLHLRYMHKLF